MTSPNFASRRFYDLADGRISALHFGDTSTAPKLVLAHANGFNAQSYRAVLEPLGVHAIALDMRGHGMSDLPTDVQGLKSWNVFRDDISAFINQYIDAPVVLAGHSFGAASAILAAPLIKDKLAGFVGLDPVSIPFLPRLFSQLPGGRAMMKKRLPIARNAGRRRFVFDSADAAVERYKGRGAFRGISDATLRDYIEGGTKPHPDGVQLACHPLWEQAVFTAQGHNIFKQLKHLLENTHIIYGGKAAVSTRRIRAVVSHKLRGGRVSFHRDFHHLFPFQEPEFSIDALKDVLARANLS